jgi:hypothetical protein
MISVKHTAVNAEHKITPLEKSFWKGISKTFFFLTNWNVVGTTTTAGDAMAHSSG